MVLTAILASGQFLRAKSSPPFFPIWSVRQTKKKNLPNSAKIIILSQKLLKFLQIFISWSAVLFYKILWSANILFNAWCSASSKCLENTGLRQKTQTRGYGFHQPQCTHHSLCTQPNLTYSNHKVVQINYKLN
jgi:hypothetical protein